MDYYTQQAIRNSLNSVINKDYTQNTWGTAPVRDLGGMIKPVSNPSLGNFKAPSNGGIDASGIGGAVTGGLATIGMGVGIANEGKNIDTSVAGAQTSATGAPVYNLGGDVQRLGDLKPEGASFGQVLSAAGSGASAGSALAPGIGTAIGAIGGALTSLIGGRIKKRRMQEAKDKLAKNVARGQADYNEADQQFDQAQIRKQEFNKRRNLTNRLYNLYGAPKYNYG